MADVRPFRGLRYDARVAGSLPDIICPPFDTIGKDLQLSLYQRSPHNVVRLESGEHLSSDTPEDSRYTRSAALLQEWLEGGVLARDREPGFYLVEHRFGFRGESRSRLELMGLVKLEEYENRVVLPHEFTRDADKRDRLALMKACGANFSPIMCLYRDDDKGLASVLRRAMDGSTIMELSDTGDQGYRVWKIADQDSIGQIEAVLSGKALYIADGHHRYETALAYRDLARAASSEGADVASDYVMMGLIEMDDPGMLVLPYHRVVGGLGETDVARVRAQLDDFFKSEPFTPNTSGGPGQFLEEIESRGKRDLVMGLLDSRFPDEHVLLSLKQGVKRDDWGLLGDSEAWILEEQSLRQALGESLARCLDYVHDGPEAEALVRSGECQLAFFLKPFPLDLFETVMTRGMRLPAKSTFFYPKLATGLVINLLSDEL